MVRGSRVQRVAADVSVTGDQVPEVVLMAPKGPEEEMVALLSTRWATRANVKYLWGSPASVADLERARISNVTKSERSARRLVDSVCRSRFVLCSRTSTITRCGRIYKTSCEQLLCIETTRHPCL
eukprot:760149-Hanusia_phi.AAC.4